MDWLLLPAEIILGSGAIALMLIGAYNVADYTIERWRRGENDPY
jgi:hypothetical protein